ncbi:MAG TPA: DNA mismatch repair endonuclease MutL [Candidatus Coprenecus stercoripullorum]|nr:DNA mismatch repair endonuclease MutL [Candidatus Coprenecus stercoripullorum]
MLKVLPPNISNLIAAGEVVQRPASVVKELMENAVDAGADSVSVIVEDAGRTLIQVMDDGCGMTRDDAVLCFARHATSKISEASDLESIMTYGFRGEALASIAAVSEVTLRTRSREDETGSETVFAASRHVGTSEVACPAGTNISVRNLFYNIPARRKFLKSDTAEWRHILSEFCKVALCRPEVNLRLVHNGRTVYDLHKGGSLKKRILDIEGKELAKELVDVDVNTSVVRISGFVSHPEDARKTSGNQYFFVNGRYFRSPYFHKAVLKSYENLIPEGFLPSYYLFFEVSPADVDVNIHPAKTEVKFENEPEIFEILKAAVKESLGKNSLIPMIDFGHDTLPDIAPVSYFPSSAAGRGAGGYQPLLSGIPDAGKPGVPPRRDFYSACTDGYDALFADSPTADSCMLQFAGKYLVMTLKSGLLAIHISRARERIFYERYLHDLDDAVPISQEILFPQKIELSPSAHALVSGAGDRLAMLGFDIVAGEDCSVTVNGLPEGFSTDAESVRRAVDEILLILEEDGGSGAMKNAASRERMAALLARSASAAPAGRLGTAQARVLVDSLFACSEPEITPSGKRCMTIITEEDLERRL